MSAASLETQKTQVLVLGSGPGGYSAAFRAADLGMEVVIVERYNTLGGVCLNVGCIPSKALLHVAKVIDEANELKESGVSFGEPKLDKEKLVAWKEGVIKSLTQGLSMLAKRRKVEVIAGEGKLIDDHHVKVQTREGEKIIRFEHMVISAGSESIKLPFMPDDPRIFDSTGALQLNDIKGDLLVIGGGIIGLEMATVYRALGVKVTIVELQDQLIPGCDADLVKPLYKRLVKQGVNVKLKTKVVEVKADKKGLWVRFEGEHATKKPECFQQILVAVGRKPNGHLIGCDKAGVAVDDHGFIPVNGQMQTNVPHIYAVGDTVPGLMLAHKAVPQGRLASEVISGKTYQFEPRCIPSVAYTDPEIAWVGLTEREAKEQGIVYKTGVFPWMASGRALSMGRTEGYTKLLFDPETNRLLGAGITGSNAGELIAECGLAIEMGCDAEDIALTIHPHPTLSESIMLATEVYEGTVTDL